MYYFDTCIWLSIFNKNEQNLSNGKNSKRLIELLLFEKDKKIYYSGFILRELEHKLKDNFEEKRNYFRNEENLIFVKATPKDYELARALETKYNKKLSFFDFLHIAICKNNKLILITLDKELIRIGKNETKTYSTIELLQSIKFI